MESHSLGTFASLPKDVFLYLLKFLIIPRYVSPETKFNDELKMAKSAAKARRDIHHVRARKKTRAISKLNYVQPDIYLCLWLNRFGMTSSSIYRLVHKFKSYKFSESTIREPKLLAIKNFHEQLNYQIGAYSNGVCELIVYYKKRDKPLTIPYTLKINDVSFADLYNHGKKWRKMVISRLTQNINARLRHVRTYYIARYYDVTIIQSLIAETPFKLRILTIHIKN